MEYITGFFVVIFCTLTVVLGTLSLVGWWEVFFSYGFERETLTLTCILTVITLIFILFIRSII